MRKRDLTQVNITRLFLLSIVFFSGAGLGFIKEQLQNAGSMALGAAISLIQQGNKEDVDDDENNSLAKKLHLPKPNNDFTKMW